MRLSEEISRIKEMMYVISEAIHKATIPVNPPFSEELQNFIEIEFFVENESKGTMKCGAQLKFMVSYQNITAKLSCTTKYLEMSVDAGPLVWRSGGDTEVVSKLSSTSATKLESAGVLINGSSPEKYQTSVTIDKLSQDPTLDTIKITMAQPGGGQEQGGNQGKPEKPNDWTDNFKCVWGHSEAKKLNIGKESHAFLIGEYVYYNNGRRKKYQRRAPMENYTCDDVNKSTTSTPDSNDSSLPEPKEVKMQYKDEKGIDKNYRYLKKGDDWFARNIKKNGQVFNLSQKSKANNDKYQSSIDNLEKASQNEDRKSLT